MRPAILMYPTMMFRVNGVDPALAGEAWTTIPELMRQAEKRGMRFARQGVIMRPQRNPVEWRVNATQVAKPQWPRARRHRCGRAELRARSKDAGRRRRS